MRRLVLPVMAVVVGLALSGAAVQAFDRPTAQRGGQAASQGHAQVLAQATSSPESVEPAHTPEAVEPAHSPETAETPEKPEAEAVDD